MTRKSDSRAPRTVRPRLADAIPSPSRKQIQAVLFAFLLVVSLPAMTLDPGDLFAEGSGTVAAQETDNVSYYDDFEDGNATDWSSTDGFNVVEDGFYGSYSLYQNDTQAADAGGQVFWDNGPDFDTKDNFEIRGSYKATGADYRTRVGVMDPDTASDTLKGAMIVHSFEYDSIYLAKHAKDEPTEDAISGAPSGEWMEYRLQFEGGHARAKIWSAGESEPSTWQLDREYDGFDGKFFFSPGWDEFGREMQIGYVDAGGHTISGQVTDQNGDPVPNATVESYGVDYAALNDTADDLDAEAERLLDEASDPFPDEWDNDLSLLGSEGVFKSSSTNYVAVHSASDWAVDGRSVPLSDAKISSDLVDLGAPQLIAPGDERLVLSIWDPSETGGLIRGQDSIDEELPGATTTGTVIIEQKSPTGETTDRMELETEEFQSIRSISNGISAKDHEAVAVDLPAGHFYRVFPEGHEETAYVISVGSPNDIARTFQSDLVDDAGQLTDRAQDIQNQIESGVLGRTTTTTDENGYYVLPVPRGVERAGIQAYKADTDLFTESTGVSLDTVREVRELGYNGSVYLSPLPKQTAVPAENVDIEMHKVDAAPFEDPEQFQSILEDFMDDYLNESAEELERLVDGILEEMGLDTLEDLNTELLELAKANEELAESLEERTDGEITDENIDEIIEGIENGEYQDDELISQIEDLEAAIAELENSMELEDSVGEIDGGFLDYTAVFDSAIDEATVIITYEDGTTEIVPDEFVTIESVGLRSGDQVSISEYPIDKDRAVADLKIQTASSDGLGSVRDQISNPGFTGDTPELNAIDVSTLRPGDGERVGLELRPEDGTGYDRLQNVYVRSPDGSQLDTMIDGERATFRTKGEGIHTIQATFLSDSGHSFVETIRIRAEENPSSPPATIRASEGPTGTYAIAGDRLDSASIGVNRVTGEVSVTATAPGDERPPPEVHLMIDSVADRLDNRISFKLLKGPDQQTVNRNVDVVYHSESLTDGSITWRDGRQPITKDGETRYGTVDERSDDKHVIRTYTDANGELDMRVTHRPGIPDRVIHRSIVLSPIDFSGWVPLATGATGAGSGIIAVGLVARKRRGDFSW